MKKQHGSSRRQTHQGSSMLRKTYRISILEGIFAQIYGSVCQIGSSYITKILVILGASPIHYSLLSALGQVSAVFQPLGLALTKGLKRRKWACVWITSAGRFLTLFLGFSLFFRDKSTGIWFILGLLFVSAGLQSAGANIWIAWLSDLVPLRIRGRFFSRRNQIMMFASLIFSYVLSFHVDLFEKAGSGFRASYAAFLGLQKYLTLQNQAWFLAAVFVVVTLLSLFGLVILSRQPERKMQQQSQRKLREIFAEPFRDKNFRLLLIFGIWWMLAIGVGSAFWGPFMLKKLQMGLFEIQLYSSLHVAASLLSLNLWGKFVDRYGNKTAMKICVFLGGLNPLFWLFMTADNHVLLWFEALSSGSMWAGAGVVTTNFVLSIAKKGSEQAYSGIYNAITGLSMMASTLLTGAFFPSALQLGSLYLEPEQVIFGVGGLLRWLTIIPLMLVVEKRAVPLRKVFTRVWTKFTP
ncbi:MAG TPA: MFS transporter [Candidatus Cloacimonadota bacterium]|mgnify:CR=1 FL=1|nr:MFS transporter [Candidatus Cloacimonadota bacterium]